MALRPLKQAAGAVVLLTACLMLTMTPGTASLAQSSQSSESRNSDTLNSLVFQYRTPYFTKDLSKNAVWADLKAAGYVSSGQTLKVKSKHGDMAAVMFENGDTPCWIPAWYTTAAAKSVHETSLAYVALKPGTVLALAPGGKLAWAPPKQGEKLVAAAVWKDWTGILISPQAWHADSSIDRPIMLWVRSANIQSRKAIPEGVLSTSSSVTIDLARNVTELLLQQGDAASKVKKLLGEPNVVEHSANLAEGGKPLRIGTTWRYERPNAQFTVSFAEDEKLVAWKWILPADPKLELGLSVDGDDKFCYDFTSFPGTATVPAKPVWRNQGELNDAYLLGATDEVLLVDGDDGGFSGMHEDSSIYAVDKASGRKLWQVNAGFGSYSAALDRLRGTAAVYTEYSSAHHRYETWVRELSLKDGHPIWERRLPEGHQMQMYAVKDSVVVYQMPDSVQDEGLLTVLDRATGAQRWTRILHEGQMILRTDSEDPNILLQDGLMLQGLNPKDGTVAWSVTGRGDIHRDLQTHPYYAYGNIRQPLQPERAAVRWFLIGNEWMLLNTGNGEKLAQYAWNRQEQFETTNEQRYILVQQSGGLSDFDGSKVEKTALYDVIAKRVLFTLSGKATNGMFDADRLYVVLNGLPAAIDREKGTLLWEMPVTTHESASPYTMDEMAKTRYAVLSRYLLLGYGSDMLVLGKQDGQVVGRLADNQIAFREARYRKGIEGLLNMEGDEIYIGSSNGGLAKYSVKALESQLDRVK